MAENGKQTVDPAQAAETPTDGADLDSLLKEWGDSPKPDPTVGRVLNAVKPVIDFARTEQAKRAIDEQTEGMNSALDFMREAEDYKEFPKKWIRGYLEVYAAENTSFADAFQDRSGNPEAWKSELAKARDVFPEWVKELPGNSVRSDVEAAKAAVSGTSTERDDEGDSDEPAAIDLWQLSDSDFVRQTEKRLAKGKR